MDNKTKMFWIFIRTIIVIGIVISFAIKYRGQHILCEELIMGQDVDTVIITLQHYGTFNYTLEKVTAENQILYVSFPNVLVLGVKNIELLFHNERLFSVRKYKFMDNYHFFCKS